MVSFEYKNSMQFVTFIIQQIYVLQRKFYIKLSTLKMKMFIVFAICIAAALAAPADDPKDAVVLKYENDNIGIDGYKFA